MTGVFGAGAVARFVWLVLTIGVAFWPTGASTLAVARQDDAPAPVEVGAGPVRERSLALVGRNVYRDDSVELFGYFTAVIGLDPDLLFTTNAPSAQTARFTYAGEVSPSSRANRGDVTVIDGAGVVRIYFDDEAGAVWDDPGSFADGQPVAELSLQLWDTLQRQAPGIGVVVGDEQLRQEMADEFVIDGERYRFGQSGIAGRLRSVGAVTDGGGEAQSPGLMVSLTGSVSVVDREAIPVSMGGPTSTAAP